MPLFEYGMMLLWMSLQSRSLLIRCGIIDISMALNLLLCASCHFVDFFNTCLTCNAFAQSRQEDERVEFEQLLSNAIHRKDWASAFQVAFQLNKPKALLNVVNQLFFSVTDDEGIPGGSEAQKTLRAIVSKLQDEQLVKLLTFLCDWNTTSGESTKTSFNIVSWLILFRSKFHSCSRSFACDFRLQSF